MSSIVINDAQEATISPSGYNRVKVDIYGIDENDLLQLVDIKTAIKYFGAEEILDEIGEAECAAHFNLRPEEEG